MSVNLLRHLLLITTPASILAVTAVACAYETKLADVRFETASAQADAMLYETYTKQLLSRGRWICEFTNGRCTYRFAKRGEQR